MTTDVFRCFSTKGAMARASVSSPPPAPAVTISLTGLLGKSAAETAAVRRAAVAIAKNLSVFMISYLRSLFTLGQCFPERPQIRSYQRQDGQRDQDLADDRRMEYVIGTTGNQQRPVVIGLHHFSQHQPQEQRDRGKAAFQHDVTQCTEGEADHHIGHLVADGEAAKQADHEYQRHDDIVRQQSNYRETAPDG